jgi:hypothetical protein
MKRTKRKETLLVNLYGGPGSGKSTTAAGVFFDLKNAGINTELAAEFAKDLTWEKRHHTLEDQIYIFGKQYHRIFRLWGKVDVIVTDSPILLTPIYDIEKRPTLKKLVMEEHEKLWTYNVFLKRKKGYNPKGRNQTEAEAKKIDFTILDMLNDCNVAYEVCEGNDKGKNEIVDKVKLMLKYKGVLGNI